MKLKLGLLIGAGIGYLFGSGKANEMWNEIKERRPDQGRDTRDDRYRPIRAACRDVDRGITDADRPGRRRSDRQHRHLGHARRLRTSEVELDRGGHRGLVGHRC